MGKTMFDVNDEAFKKYGRVIHGYDVKPLLCAMEETPVPEGTIYVPGDEKLEALEVSKEIERVFFGELPIQTGYCNGHNTELEALEYHRCSEINIAVTDMILLLGKTSELTEDYHYNLADLKSFFVPAGTVVEMYSDTLHYAPVHTSQDGFRCVVILPKGTNYELSSVHNADGEDTYLAAKNKWLIKAERFIGGL